VNSSKNLKFPIVFKSAGKNNIKKNGHFYEKSVFDKIDFGFWGNSK